jgi:potassium channel
MKSSSFESTSQPGRAGSSGSGSGSFNLRNLSKVILPPLGRSTSGHGLYHAGTDKWVISPLDSRYR